MSLYARLESQASSRPDHIAIDAAGGELSYRQLMVLVDQCVDYFDTLGFSAGARVAIISLNHPDWFIVLLAAARCNLIVVPLNWRLSIDELNYVINDCQPALLLHDKEFANVATELAATHGGLPLARCANSNFPPKAADSIPDRIRPAPNDALPFLIVYTSGSTGRPKGAVLSQRALLCSATMSQHMLSLNNTDRVLNVLPLFHVGGLNIQPLPTLLYGATLVLHERFNPDDAARALAEKQITLVNTVPTILQAMLASPMWNSDAYSALESISIGSTDVPVELIKQVHNCGIPLIQIYGATETGPVAIYQRAEDSHRVGSIGRAGSHCHVRLVDQQGNEVPQGESGEIQIRGDNILSYYLSNEEATQASIIEGWFSTGDVAHQDDDGYYWFDDRLKHVIISGGENIYPAEIERVIQALPNVEAVAVVGIADDRWGEVPVAVVVATVDKENILQACQQLARFKQPRKVVFVDELPRNALGKVQIQKVKALL